MDSNSTPTTEKLFFCFNTPTIGYATQMTIDLVKIHQNFLRIKDSQPYFSKRRSYFLAACLYFDSNIDLEVALKLRPYGGLIGIDNSRLDHYLKESKVLRLHAIIHDAAGFVWEYSKTGPGYVYAVSCPISSPLAGHVTGIGFCLYHKLLRRSEFRILEC